MQSENIDSYHMPLFWNSHSIFIKNNILFSIEMSGTTTKLIKELSNEIDKTHFSCFLWADINVTGRC